MALQIRRGATADFVAPPDAAKLRVAGAGHSAAAAVADGNAAFDTSAMPIGLYQSEWEHGDGRLAEGPRFEIVPSLKIDKLTDAEPPQDERILAAARRALEVASASTDIGFSVAESSWSFENRGDLLSFVQRMESKVGRKNAARRYRRYTP